MGVFTHDACAQARKGRKPAKVAAPVKTQEDINFDNLLSATAKVSFIDSTTVSADNYVSSIPLSSSAGRVSIEMKDSVATYSYINEQENKKIIAVAEKEGNHKLFSLYKEGTSWSAPEPIEISGNFTDIICPYMMSDGVTLYFAAKGGNDNVGGYDIFFTFYDADDERYANPQSLGLPYNSTADDFYCITDEYNQLGYLVTSRMQDTGKVCIYPFIPTESRETYAQSDDIIDEELIPYAKLTSIAKTQTDKKAVESAQKRLYDAKHSLASKGTTSVCFQLNGKIIYTSLSDFRNKENGSKYAALSERKAELSEKEKQLEEARVRYHNGDKRAASTITSLEEWVMKQRTTLAQEEKAIRESELKLYK